MRLLICFCTLLWISGCAFNPPLKKQTIPVQVEVSKGFFVSLPTPAQLQHPLNVSQLISAQWGEQQQQQLLVQLQVDSEQVVLAGFSSWGARILSLTYSEGKIETYTMPGLGDNLPKPEQVLFNVMLAIWPVESWSAPLKTIGWRLHEQPLKRLLIDANNQIVVEINYSATPHLAGLITFQHIPLNYTIKIETNSEL